MFEFIAASANVPFAVALLVLFIIAILEGVGSLLGAGISNVFASLFPGADVDFNIEGPDLDSPTAFGRILSWLRVGQVPILVLLIVFLAAFGITGLVIQSAVYEAFGFLLPAIVAVIPAFLLSLPAVRVLGGGLAHIIPKDETSAVSKDTFVGLMAQITLGTASKGSAAEGKVKDSFGQYHYIMIEPDNEQDSFSQGSEVLLVRQDGTKFYAIDNENPILKGE